MPTKIIAETRFLSLCIISRNRVSSDISRIPTKIIAETRFLGLCNNLQKPGFLRDISYPNQNYRRNPVSQPLHN